MKLVIVGGHLSPALAVIEALPKDTEILFIGRKHTFEGDPALSFEYVTVTSLKIPFENLDTGRLQRKFSKNTIPSLLKIPYGFVRAFSVLYRFKPDVVLSFGGYLSLPVVLASYLLGIPIVIHEQTLKVGLANRIASYFATKVCISWESSRRFFPKQKTVFTGNPVRRLEKIDNFGVREHNYHATVCGSYAARNQTALPIVYITGGSSGSHFINTLVGDCIEKLLEKFVVIHQTGDSQEYRDFDRLTMLRDSLPSKLKKRYILKKFVDYHELGAIYKKATLVISRAGINTVSELIYFGKRALLIPFPFSPNNEQLENALFFKNLGFGEVLEQKFLDRNLFLQKIKDLVNNIDNYTKNRKKGISINSSDKIIEIIKNVKKNKNKEKEEQKSDS